MLRMSSSWRRRLIFMKNNLREIFKLIVLILIISYSLLAHDRKVNKKEGKVSFITSQNIYLQFENTDGISTGDTLYSEHGRKIIPVMVVKFLSSQSVAGEKVGDADVKIGDIIFALVGKDEPEITQVIKAGNEKDTNLVHSIKTQTVKPDKFSIPVNRKYFYGSFNANSFSNYANYPNSVGIQRWNYSLNMQAENIGGSSFYFSNYMNLSYMSSEWRDVKANVFNNLRVYDLSLGYKVKGFNIWMGRHINNNISSIGPIDGLQTEKSIGNFALGAVIGSRPDYYNLGLNSQLFEYGAYLNRSDSVNNGVMQSTLAIFQQTNHSKTDRRFLYFQHTDNAFTNLYFFLSSEVDLYKEQNNVQQSEFSLTSIFFNTQYSPARIISINLSYDARKNVIYYQTFKSFLDSLFTNEMRQGLQLGFFLRPVMGLFINLNGGYSYQKGDIRASRNFSISISESEIPLLDITAIANFNRVYNNFQDGSIYGITLYKYLHFNASTISIGVSNIIYNFGYNASKFFQKSINAQINTRILGTLFFNFFYEGDFTGKTTYNRFMTGLNYRF